MSDLLTASHLAAEEEAVVAFGLVPEDLGETEFTLPNAVERLRRIAYHEKRIAKAEADHVALNTPLIAAIGANNDWVEAECAAPLSSIAHHESWLRRYYELNPPTKGKTVKLPNGVLQQTQPAPTWSYYDDVKILEVLKAYRNDLIRTVEPVVDKVALKGAVSENHIINGIPHIVNGAGELVPLEGVTVTTPPPKFTVKVND